MTPEDRQLQGALAVVEARLGGPGGTAAPLPGTTPPVTRLSPPPLPARAPDALGTPSEPSPLRAAAPLVFAPSRPAAAPAPEPGDDGSSEGGPLPPTLRIHASQTSAPPVLPPLPSAVPPPAPPPPPPPAVGVRATAGPETTLVPDAGGLGTLPVRRVEAAIAESAAQDSVAEQAAAEGPSGATAPFSSSTLAELYFQQGLVDRAVDVYHQLLEQEPHNEKAQKRLAELRLGAPAADERAARRRAHRADHRRPRRPARSRAPAMSLPAFAQVLERVAGSVPETEVLMVIATDGIPIEKLTVRADPNMEAVAAEHTTLLRASLAAAADTGLGRPAGARDHDGAAHHPAGRDHARLLPVRVARARGRSWAAHASRCAWRPWHSSASSSNNHVPSRRCGEGHPREGAWSCRTSRRSSGSSRSRTSPSSSWSRTASSCACAAARRARLRAPRQLPAPRARARAPRQRPRRRPAATAAAPAPADAEADGTVVRSPIVGTFYRSPDPNSPVFVSVGDSVKVGPGALHHRSHEADERDRVRDGRER